MPRTISVQLWSVREDLARDPDATLGRLADLGFRAVEPFGLTDAVATLAEPLRAHGLDAPTAHVNLVGADLDAVRAASEVTGTRLVVEPFIPAERWGEPDGIARLADALNAAAERLAPDGIRVGYHNHHWETELRVDDRPAILALAAALDKRVAIELDTYWAAVGGVDPVALLTELGPRVAAIHVKDGPISHDGRAQLPAGQGAMPLAEVLAAAPGARRVLEFDDYAGDIYAGLAIGRDALARIEGVA